MLVLVARALLATRLLRLQRLQLSLSPALRGCQADGTRRRSRRLEASILR